MKRIVTHTALVAIIAALGAGPAWAAWNFVHITDIHVDTTNGDPAGGNFGRMMDNIRAMSPPPSFVIASGDLVDHGMTGFWSTKVDSANWRCLTRKIYKNGNTWYAKYTGGAYSIPIYFTPGNHDDRVDNVPTNIYPGESLNGYDQFIGYNSSKKPVSPLGALCTFGTGDASHDYWFTYNNALVISMYSGTDYGTNSDNPNSAGLKPAQLTFLSSALKANAAKTPKIIFLHHPAHSAPGTLVTGEPFNAYVNGGNFYNYQSNFDDTLAKYTAVVSGTTYYPVAFHGHVEQNVVCNRSCFIQDKNWTGGVRYVQTAACKDGTYRIITMTDANPNFASVGAPVSIAASPSVRIITPIHGTLSPGNAVVTVNTMPQDANKINKVDISVNGTLAQTLTSLPYATNIVVPATTGNCVITAKAYDMSGNTNTASVTINGGVSAYYDRLNVGSSAYVNCPKCKGVITATLNDILVNGSNGKRQAKLTTNCSCGGWTRYIDVETVLRLTGSGAEAGLFAYPARIFDAGGLRCADIMIAPYQYPTFDIVYPVAGQRTNICEVQLATNYSGKNVPWTSANQKPNTDGVFSNTSDRFVWDMSAGTGPRTLTVTLRDVFGTQVSKTVTVTYDNTVPFYVYRGPFGDSWKGKSVSFGPYGNQSGSYKTIVYYNYWDGSDPMGTHWGGNSGATSRDHEISIIAGTMISGPLSTNIPAGSTPVYVVNKTEYTSDILNDGYWGTITWKEIYDRLALLLGRDSNGKTRVWACPSSADRGVQYALADVEPPVVSIEGLPNYAIVAPGTATPVNISAYDFSGIAKVELYVNDTLKGTDNTASPYVITWTTPAAIAYDKDYAIKAKAYGNDGRTTTTSPISVTIRGTLSNPIVNGGFESHGGWVVTTGGIAASINPPCGSLYINNPYGISGPCGASIYQTNIFVPGNATVLKYKRAYGGAAYKAQWLCARVWINSNVVESHCNVYDYQSFACGWEEMSIDVTAYRNQNITIKFELARDHNGGSYTFQGSMSVDDVRIENTVSNPVAYWKFDEGAGATIASDASGSGNSGTISGATWATGKVGNALSFDGIDDYVSYSYSAGKPSNTFTLAAWVKTTATHEIDGESTSGYGGCSGQKWVFAPIHEGNNGGIGVSVGTNGISVYEHGSNYLPALAVYNGTVGTNWAYVVVTVSNKTPAIYLNGNLVRTGLTSPRPVSYAPTQIGSYAYGAFNGQIDDVRIFNRALSSLDVQYLYNNPGKSVQSNEQTLDFPQAMPRVTQLMQNAPNPITQLTTISYQLVSPANVSLRVYNITGQIIKTLVNESLPPGYHSVKWDGRDANGSKVAAGVYLYRMEAGDYSKTNKMMVLQ